MSNLIRHPQDHSYDKIGLLRSRGLDKDATPSFLDNAITTSVEGTCLTRGRTLASEIDWYRHRVEALVHFLDRMAPQWWDHMHPFGEGGKLVRRPSRTADKLRAVHDRLASRLARLTPRMIALATNAVMSIEETESISILPPSLRHVRSAARAVGTQAIGVEKQLFVIFTFVRRISEIERLKQQLILHTIDWIKADGNDLQVRAQRLERLAQHVQPCLIENHEGVAALIRHYFRRRSNPKGDEKIRQILDSSDDAKMQLEYAFNAVTADRIYSTNRLIVELIETRLLERSSIDTFNSELTKTMGQSLHKPSFENLIGRSIKEVYEWAKRCTGDDAGSTITSSNMSTGWLRFGKTALFGETFEPESMSYDLKHYSEDEEEEIDLPEIRRRVLADLRRHESEANAPIFVNDGLPGGGNLNTREEHQVKKGILKKTLWTHREIAADSERV
ncbi:hypothetical protein TcWFU_004788 [Taenia crassiceps]|uniref:DUF5738 domain-containing protein n=1 Tax=Taenia crassiceps TaxID=6207 RepID=A0ABR4Q2H8_9CEST